ncbi:MAG: DUF2442 domain-containing protein [Bacteroidetes bacterium]|nr:DUF2442 domain-containing protein [Bacteroidota bacterium]
MYKPIKVKALDSYKIWVKFEDGTEGQVDLSGELGKGVFEYWNDHSNFRKVYINNETDGIAWNEELEICPETVYYEILEQAKKAV